jgi:hypothetical protein
MLASKTSKGAFDDCRGWCFCAQALEREAEAKRLQMNRFMDRAFSMSNAFFSVLQMNLVVEGGFSMRTSFLSLPTLRKDIDQARETNSRLLSIDAFLPQANRLAVLSYPMFKEPVLCYTTREDIIAHFDRWERQGRERRINRPT